MNIFNLTKMYENGSITGMHAALSCLELLADSQYEDWILGISAEVMQNILAQISHFPTVDDGWSKIISTSSRESLEKLKFGVEKFRDNYKEVI